MTQVQASGVRRQRSGSAIKQPRVTREQRSSRGRAARSETPRSSHAEFAPGPHRPDPVGQLEGQGAARVPELLPIRYGRMAISPFTFFRGAALVMASDLASTPSSGITVQACGDAHLSNFGMFASPERRLVFDINDFDETLPGPWEWDIKRLATSVEVAGRDIGFSAKERSVTVLATVAAYRRAMLEFAKKPALEVWYAHADVAEVQARLERVLDRQRRKTLARSLVKAQTKDNLGALDRFAGKENGSWAIVAEPPLIVPLRDLVGNGTAPGEATAQLRSMLDAYRTSLEPERQALLDRYELVDLARKVVGVGSVGTRAYMLLLLGDDERDPLFLQAKEAGASVLEEFVEPSTYDNCGQRVVVGQRLMQTVSDIFLGWVRVQGFDGRTRDFYLRQLRDWKGSAEIEAMVPAGMRVYGELCGWTLARAHARSGDRIAIAAYLGGGPAFDHAVHDFARAYADQNERDHRALLDAIAAGSILAAEAES
jgi:uncharacterized protein (DUF2252 family)